MGITFVGNVPIITRRNRFRNNEKKENDEKKNNKEDIKKSVIYEHIKDDKEKMEYYKKNIYKLEKGIADELYKCNCKIEFEQIKDVSDSLEKFEQCLKMYC